MRLREVKWQARAHTGTKWKSWDSREDRLAGAAKMIEMPLWHQKTPSSFRKSRLSSPSPLSSFLTLHVTLLAGHFHRVRVWHLRPFLSLSNWSIIALQCCVGFRGTVKRISYMYTCAPSLWTSLETILPFWVITEHQVSSLCYTAVSLSVQFRRSVVSLCDPVACSMPGFPVHQQLVSF